MPSLQVTATTLLALGSALAATYLRSSEFFQHPVLQALGLPLGLALTALGAVLLGVGTTRLKSRFGLSNVDLDLWVCSKCGQTNEADLVACWSCGLPPQLSRPVPVHVPEETRWQCPRCSVWNGILRTRCWHCGFKKDMQDTSPRRPTA